MSGLALMRHDNATQLVDAVRDEHGFIALTSGLETPVLISLFTDRRARPSDDVPLRRGWWGDAHSRVDGDQIGSLLWLLERHPLTPATLRRAEVFARDALQWLKDDGLAKSIAVTIEAQADGLMAIEVQIAHPDGTVWSKIWDQHGNEVNRAVQ